MQSFWTLLDVLTKALLQHLMHTLPSTYLISCMHQLLHPIKDRNAFLWRYNQFDARFDARNGHQINGPI